MKLNFHNRFVDELPADPETGTQRRQVHLSCYSMVEPAKVSAPSLVSYSKEAAALIDLTEADCQSEQFLQAFVGNNLLDGMQGHSMCYGGHQFGNWAGQLGDGRAINLGEALNQKGEYWSLQLKGAGETPYSRTADGLAVLRSSIREYLCSEAMFHLGVPTTRALSLCLTGEQVMRDMLYDGHPEYEPGAVVCRMAPSFIRFGSFQIFSARKEYDELRQLADFTIKHYFSHLLELHAEQSKELYLAWFDEICSETLKMVVHWMRVGFVHGVMNTDNMSIHGLTIDYGPYGWLDNFDPDWTPNTTDAQGKRYRFGQQPNVALWNLYQLANSLYPLIEDTESLEKSLEAYQANYQVQHRNMMLSKLGLQQPQDGDAELVARLLDVISAEEVDMTIFFRCLSSAEKLDYAALAESFYDVENHSDEYIAQLNGWLSDYARRCDDEGVRFSERAARMNAVNPKFVFRNYLAQQAIDKSEQGDHSMVNELLQVFRNPYSEQAEYEHYAAKRPDWAKTKVGCSMLSCSS